jgi:DNA-binding SARP family transcriptional activator
MLAGQESERWVSGHLFRAILHWMAHLGRWVWRYDAYLLEIFTGSFLLLMELLLLLSFPSLAWVRFWYLWLWEFWPAPPLGLPALSVFQIFGGFALLGALLVMPPLGVLLIRDGRVQIALWSADPNGQTIKLLRRERAQLAYWRVLAEEENEIDRHWRRLWRGRQPPDDDALSAPRPLRKYAGPASFAYVTLSAYLGIPPASLHYEDEITSTMPPQAEKPSSEVPESPGAPYQVLLFGSARIQIVGETCVEVVIKSWRQRALLAYLALVAREKETQWEHLVNRLYEKDGEGIDKERLQEDLYSDVKALRRLVRERCDQAGIPYIDPIEVSGRGRGARYRLAQAYQLVDLARFDRLMERLERIRQTSTHTDDLLDLRAEYRAVLAAYAGGLLGQQVRENRIGTWATPYYLDYRNKYHRLLHDLAEYEHRLSAKEQGEERKASLLRAVKLYEECALQAAPTQQIERKEGYLSEHALRECFLIYGELGDRASAQHLKSVYSRTMKRRFSDWELQPETEKVFEAITHVKDIGNYPIKIEDLPPQQG